MDVLTELQRILDSERERLLILERAAAELDRQRAETSDKINTLRSEIQAMYYGIEAMKRQAPGATVCGLPTSTGGKCILTAGHDDFCDDGK